MYHRLTTEGAAHGDVYIEVSTLLWQMLDRVSRQTVQAGTLSLSA